jgi:hypothetical protein
MALSIDFIVSLVLNLISLSIGLITIWQTRKIQAMKQRGKLIPTQTKLHSFSIILTILLQQLLAQNPSSQDLEANRSAQAIASINERAPTISREKEDRSTCSPFNTRHPARPPRAIIKEEIGRFRLGQSSQDELELNDWRLSG